MRKWNLSTPTYDSDIINPSLKTAYWEGHRDFAYDLLQFVRPETLVELGSQYGCSLFCFCQAVKDFNLKTKIHAVDLWNGDIGAVDDGATIYNLVQKTKEKYFSEQEIHLYQMNFDSALSFFEKNSIDILHIDGSHKFEDVEHDFSTWLPKLKKNGIILFHDVYSPFDEGSCIHWKKTCKQFTYYFDFTHSCGLGILFPKGNYWYQKLKNVHFFEYYKDLYFYRSKYNYIQFRFDEICHLYEERYAAIQQQSDMIKERDKTIESQAQMLQERYAAIQQQSNMIKERDKTIELQSKMLEKYNTTV